MLQIGRNRKLGTLFASFTLHGKPLQTRFLAAIKAAMPQQFVGWECSVKPRQIQMRCEIVVKAQLTNEAAYALLPHAESCQVAWPLPPQTENRKDA